MRWSRRIPSSASLCLTAATGELEWAQTLAAVKERLTTDVGRRVQAVHLAYGDGVLVCPTNAGAILGVDLLTHSLVWAKPYREAQRRPPGTAPGHDALRPRRHDAAKTCWSISISRLIGNAQPPSSRTAKWSLRSDGSSIYC